MFKYLKINYQTILLILSLIVLGIFCIILKGENFIAIFSYLAAGILILLGIAMIAFSIRYYDYLQSGSFLDRSVGYFTYGTVLIASAVLIILFPDYLVRILIGISLIIFPTVRLIQAKDKKRYLRNNFWKYLIGVIFIIAVDVIMEVLFDFLGIAFIAGAIFLTVMLIKNYQNKEEPNLFSKYIIYIIKQKTKE